MKNKGFPTKTVLYIPIFSRIYIDSKFKNFHLETMKHFSKFSKNIYPISTSLITILLYMSTELEHHLKQVLGKHFMYFQNSCKILQPLQQSEQAIFDIQFEQNISTYIFRQRIAFLYFMRIQIALVVGFQNIQTPIYLISKHGFHVVFNELRRNFPTPKQSRLTILKSEIPQVIRIFCYKHL